MSNRILTIEWNSYFFQLNDQHSMVLAQTANSIDFLRLLGQIAVVSAVTGGAVTLMRRAAN